MSSPPSACSSSAASSSLEVGRPSRSAHQPNFPVTYSSVRLSAGFVKIVVGRRVLDQLAGEHERRRVGDARGLLHVVRDDDDRVALLELLDQLLDLQRRDRVERRARLVHQDHLGLDGDRARDAEALLLAAATGRCPGSVSRSLTSSHSAGAAQRLLDALLDVAALDAGEPQAGRDVVEDRHRRERVRLLEDHADRAAHRDDVDRRAVDVVARRAVTVPSARAPGISSCMRLMQRTSVDLPQPDGPIIAVTWLGAKSRSTPLTAWSSP